METTSKSTDLLARLRSVTLEDEMKLSDFWPSENSYAETSMESSCKTDSLNNYKPSWEDTDSTLRSAAFTNAGRKLQFESNTPKKEPVVESTSVPLRSVSEPIENRENPFAKISRKSSDLTSKLSKKLHGWLTSTSCFGILGVICGGSLAAWSLLGSTGSHSMTALGFSLTISGLLMLVLVGICQTALHISGQT